MKTETEVNTKFTKQISKTQWQTAIVYCGHNWGRGATLNEAIKGAKVHPANKFYAYIFTSTEPIEAWVSDSGNYHYETITNEAKVTIVEIGDMQNWFSGDDEIEQLWQSLCSAIREKDNGLAASFEDKTYRMLEKYIKD